MLDIDRNILKSGKNSKTKISLGSAIIIALSLGAVLVLSFFPFLFL